ncbi:MAG TPA: hypothetical protein VH188_04245, partial [Chthoniobacterales bacterium]|nr:hypothetical protein [Chthoniobacterales bacterium]
MRTLNYSILGLASFCVTAFALHSLLPLPQVAGVTPKLLFLAAHPNTYDTIFLGSSRVYHGVNPATFDGAMAAGGKPAHSYNLGIDGMLPPETFYVIDQLLAANPRGLRRIFIELEDVQISVAPEHVRTRRALYWHDWERSAIIARKILEMNVAEKWKQKGRRLARNREAFLADYFLFGQNLANTGRGFDLLGLTPSEDDLSESDYEPRGDGYAPAVANMKPDQAARYEAWLERDLADPHPRAVDAYAETAFRHYANRFRSLGVVPIFFVTPGSATVLPSKFRTA